MLVVKGYKQSEVGKIPIDWEVKRFTDCANLKHGFQFREEHFSQTGVKIIKIGNLKYSGELDLEKITFVPSEQLSKFSNFLLNRGDILMALTGATLGKTSIVNTDELLLQNYRVGNFYNNPNYSKNYIYYLLQSKFIQKTINKLVNEAAQPNLGKGDFDKFIVPIPPTITEQNEITTALIDADSLISSLKKLIDKKRKIKQGAMQQLFKTKEGWVVKEIKSLFQFRQGIQCSIDNQKSDYKEGLIRFIRIIDLTQANELPRFIDNPGDAYHVNIDDLFMVRYGNPGLLGYGFKGVIANNLFRLIPKIKMANKFFYYLLSFKNEDILQLTSSTTMAALNFTSLNSLSLCYPPSIYEQENIISILEDMENEINLLEKKLSKIKSIKQGMMQNLLTGKIRLV